MNSRIRFSPACATIAGLSLAFLAAACNSADTADTADAADVADSDANTVTATVQMRPGGPFEKIEMEVHEAPVDPPTVAADAVDLQEDELVVGVVLDGQAIAYPVRYLAMSEVVNDRVGDTPIAPSW